MLRSLFISLSKSTTLRSFVMKNALAQKAARRFVSGVTLDEALPAIRDLNAKGAQVTMDFLGESVATKPEAIASADEAIRILEFIASKGIQGNVSVKLTQLGLELGQDFCRDNVARVVDKAKALGNFVRIDMEDTAATDRTLEIFYAMLERVGPAHVGIVLQSYLYRTEKDAAEVMNRGGRIRLCKGAYKEPASAAYPKKRDVNANYIRVMKQMLDSGIYHGIATHDENMIRETKAYAEQNKIDRKRFEFQMLYGIRRDLQEQLPKEGYNMRVYVPYGDQWYPYNMRRLAERPANLLFVLKNLFR